MENKNMPREAADIRKTYYNNLKQRQCALNMQIRLAMQTYDMDLRVRLEKELEVVNEKMKEFGG